ncbi:hypothetical protein ACFV8T_03435 [Streptomyces sp. NPDC059832]|uniref:hypothetical protein n=1 Tax=unclassified Streptomyces TaxID=2593676 RepID=UPI003653F35F
MAKVLEFSIRTTVKESLEEVRKSVEGAFNCQFIEGEYDEIDAYVAVFLGMNVGLFQWGGDFILDTRIEDLRFLEAAEKKRLEVVRISDAVADTLNILGPFKWRVATDEDLARDAKFADEMEQRMAAENIIPPWPEGDE